MDVIDGWDISCEIALIWLWISLHFTDDQSTSVQVMAWCRQATSHYLSQCWPRSLLPYGVTRPQWVNTLGPRHNGRQCPPFSRRHFQMHFLEWKCLNFSIQISLNFVPKAPVIDIAALVQVMVWRRPCDKPLSEPMMVSLLTHFLSLYTRPQWVKTLRPRQNGCHFPDDIFKCIFLNENVILSIRISLKFVLRVQLTIFQHRFR